MQVPLPPLAAQDPPVPSSRDSPLLTEAETLPPVSVGALGLREAGGGARGGARGGGEGVGKGGAMGVAGGTHKRQAAEVVLSCHQATVSVGVCLQWKPSNVWEVFGAKITLSICGLLLVRI